MKKLTAPILLVGAPDRVTDLRYRTGLKSNDPVVYLEERHARHMLVSPLDFEHARRAARGMHVWSPADLDLRSGAAGVLSGWVFALLRKLNVRAVTVPPYFPVGLARRLAQGRIRLNVAREALFPQRQVKTGVELLHLQKCQNVAIQAMRLAVALIADARVDRAGRLCHGRTVLTSEQMRLRINQFLLQAGCQGTGTIVAVGRQTVCPHEPGWGPLFRGASIIIDIFPQDLSSGYWGDLTRTFVKGRAERTLKAMYLAVREAQLAAFATMKAGVSAGRVHRAVEQVLRKRGFTNRVENGRPQGFIHSTGHGIGLDIHEPPRLARSAVRLQAGNVLTVEPGLYYQEVGGVRVEDVVVVTSSGCEVSGRCPHLFEIP